MIFPSRNFHERRRRSSIPASLRGIRTERRPRRRSRRHGRRRFYLGRPSRMSHCARQTALTSASPASFPSYCRREVDVLDPGFGDGEQLVDVPAVPGIDRRRTISTFSSDIAHAVSRAGESQRPREEVLDQGVRASLSRRASRRPRHLLRSTQHLGQALLVAPQLGQLLRVAPVPAVERREVADSHSPRSPGVLRSQSGRTSLLTSRRSRQRS